LKFDYTYIAFRDFLVFEPMIIVSNSIMLALSVIFALRLLAFRHNYARSMSAFMVMLGCSAIFGAICHSVHYQNGKGFFDLMFFFMNAFSLLSIFFCFKATYLYAVRGKKSPGFVLPLCVAITCLLLLYSYVLQQFLLIKIVAGAVLVYSLVVHALDWKRKARRGSLMFVYAILSSFLSIAVHSAHISFHEWFNYKDFAHVFMILAMILFYRGGLLNSGPAPDRTRVI
jgi:hypothetical protein